MKRILFRRPSPAMVVALGALFVSLGGVSYGVATGSIDSREIKNNTVRSKDIRNSQVYSKDVRNSQIFTQDIRNSTVRGTDVRNNTLSGADILESSLGTVPSANTANTAGRANSAANVDKLKTVGSSKVVQSSSSDADTATARAGATKVPFYSFGAFDVYLKCFTDTDDTVVGSQGTYAEAYISTRVNNSIFDADNDSLDGDPAFLNTDSSEDNTELEEAFTGVDGADIDADEDGAFGAAAPDGTGISGQVGLAAKNGDLAGGNGIYGGGNACVMWGDVIG